MFVVTAAAGEERAGCLVGFLTQCSIDPPRFLVCLSKQNRTCRVARRSPVLAVHLLPAGQLSLAELFGGHTGDEIDKFDRCRWSAGPHGVPLLEDCPNRFIGSVIARHDLGDHTGHLLGVAEAHAPSALELLTFHDVRHLTPGHPA